MIETTGNRTMTMRTTDKPFKITKQQVYEAYKAVKSNQGAASVDQETIEQFDADLKVNFQRRLKPKGEAAQIHQPPRSTRFASRVSAYLAHVISSTPGAADFFRPKKLAQSNVNVMQE